MQIRNHPYFLEHLQISHRLRMEVHEIMPSGISYFLHLGISDPSKFKEQINTYFGGLGILGEVESEAERMKNAIWHRSPGGSGEPA